MWNETKAHQCISYRWCISKFNPHHLRVKLKQISTPSICGSNSTLWDIIIAVIISSAHLLCTLAQTCAATLCTHLNSPKWVDIHSYRWIWLDSSSFKLARRIHKNFRHFQNLRLVSRLKFLRIFLLAFWFFVNLSGQFEQPIYIASCSIYTNVQWRQALSVW